MPAGHSHDFLNPAFLVQGFHLAGGAAAGGGFVNIQVVVRKAGNLGQVGNAQHLALAGNQAIFSAIFWAVTPPTPVSISSKIMVGTQNSAA